MSQIFLPLLKKVASGTHTSKDLTRTEAAIAMELMLRQEATPAQIGAFLIAHRIKRPTGAELAGMLDAYEELGPKIPLLQTTRPVVILSQPYDGRDRTVPLSVITALILAAAGCPVMQHGGERMPTKEGIPLVDLWRGLGVAWSDLSMSQVHRVLGATGLGFVYLPTHFPQAQALVGYRREIGKRPPLATLELIWSPYAGPCGIAAGFVHPPTELMIQEALFLRGVEKFITVKGVEGSCDLPQERTAIIGLHQSSTGAPTLNRLRLHSQEYDLAGKNPAWLDLDTAIADMQAVIAGAKTPLRQAVLWNSGFYLWQYAEAESLTAGLAWSQELLDQGRVQQQLAKLQAQVTGIKNGSQLE